MVSTYREREKLAVDTTGLEDVESSETFRNAQTIVFLVVNDELRCLPVVEEATWVILVPGV